jgi:hypothetical protein
LRIAGLGLRSKQSKKNRSGQNGTKDYPSFSSLAQEEKEHHFLANRLRHINHY